PATRRGGKAGKRGGAAEAFDAATASPEAADSGAKPARGAGTRDAAEDRPPAPARTPGPTVAQQYLVLTGGSPFLRAIGFIQHEGGEPLQGFRDVTVTKMASPPLPTEAGTYEFRFKVRNDTGDFDLTQRAENGTTSNKKRFEVSGTDALQTYRFTLG
ncbi:MAG TPA: hypothetical protein VK420_23290, partial [Longimicrobium sp.]|nr:hypothetical protein [Longimicrobium sp.]